MKRSYIREILDAIDENTISFAGGLPNEDLFPSKQLKEASKKVFKNKNSLQYSKSQGIDSLREKIASFYTKYYDFETTKDEILITTGSQQAFDIILKSLDAKNLVVESPSYIGALSAFKILKTNIQEFKTFEQLENILKKDDVIYSISDYQNPSTNTYTKKQREEFANILHKKDVYFIEDAAYSLLSFDGKIRKPISRLYKDKSYHLGTFSKIVAPGLRVGWIRANKELIEKILAVKESLDLHTSTFNQMLIDTYLDENDVFKHIKKNAKNYKKRMNFMADCMEKYLPNFEFKRPKGGMFIYGRFNNIDDSMNLAKEALKENIAFVPAEVFYFDNQKSNEARFNFTNCDFKKTKKGIRLLAKLIK
ncbi:aminotransferase class I [Malaciobacter molluscorum]|uniref:aminotransferase-like domain-containing protein n=1 Tax=Malaciobacter molluscorum TaxID=1032072 RepID=UPI00100A8E0F|nr:PLP-dependent aminotransferase family protein [Malaciobacter molluscorum]RXJ96187.1 aminotransferase class I [Malaciobacter molluscorum]